MSDYGDFCREMREARQAHRRKMSVENQRFVTELEGLDRAAQWEPVGAGIRFTFSTGERIDIWLQTGKWTVVGSNRYNVGLRKLVNHVKETLGEVPPDSVLPTSRSPGKGTVGFRVNGNVTTPHTWPPKSRGAQSQWNTDPNSPPWEV